MLFELLEMLRSGGTHTIKDMARQLDVSEMLVQSMINELVRLGYLKLAAQTCPGSCEGCPMVSCCAIGSKGRLWTLTDVGRKAMQSEAP